MPEEEESDDDYDDDIDDDIDADNNIVVPTHRTGYFNPDIPADVLAEMRSPVVAGPPGFLTSVEE
jgi:hypothetical protein